MINVDEAVELILSTIKAPSEEMVAMNASCGRVLAEDIYCDRPMPPFDRVTMDGIAIRYQAYEKGERQFKVKGIAPAGAPQQVLDDEMACVEVMTGCPLPRNTDTVIRYEDLTQEGNVFSIKAPIKKYGNVHYKGSDHTDGAVLLNKRRYIKPIDINVIATVGKTHVRVYQNPNVAVVSSGDELVEVGEQPADYQIRRSNVHMIVSNLKQLDIHANDYHFVDDLENIKAQLEQVVQEHDAIIMSGGVSKGKFDFIPQALEDLGFTKLFHRVAQRPGKPFWFGKKGDKVVFAFPGNPVSTLSCFHRYFMPWFSAYRGVTYSPSLVELKEDVSFRPDLTYFAQAKLSQSESGVLMAEVTHGNGSGDMVNPTMVDGFVELKRGSELYKKGLICSFYPFTRLFY